MSNINNTLYLGLIGKKGRTETKKDIVPVDIFLSFDDHTDGSKLTLQHYLK